MRHTNILQTNVMSETESERDTDRGKKGRENESERGTERKVKGSYLLILMKSLSILPPTDILN